MEGRDVGFRHELADIGAAILNSSGHRLKRHLHSLPKPSHNTCDKYISRQHSKVLVHETPEYSILFPFYSQMKQINK